MDIAVFQKNGSEEVRAQLATVGGRPVASLRVYETRNGRTFPSRTKGLAFAVESLPALEEAVRELREAAKNPASFQ
jgi:hypothetical protein